MARYRPPKVIKKKRLKRILRRFKCGIDKTRGKGSHWIIWREVPDGTVPCFTLPDRPEYGHDYIGALRRALELAPENGISHKDFFEG